MLHTNLKAVCSPQIASIGGGAGDTGVHFCAHSGILEELLLQLQLRFMAQNCPMWHKNVICFPSENGWDSLTYVHWSKSLNKKNANRKTASCHKRGLILHIGSFSQNYLTSNIMI